jgi:hypothetical protein
MYLGDYYMMPDPENRVDVWTLEITALCKCVNFLWCLGKVIVMENLDSSFQMF